MPGSLSHEIGVTADDLAPLHPTLARLLHEWSDRVGEMERQFKAALDERGDD